jgi:hypothetical protein
MSATILAVVTMQARVKKRCFGRYLAIHAVVLILRFVGNVVVVIVAVAVAQLALY